MIVTYKMKYRNPQALECVKKYLPDDIVNNIVSSYFEYAPYLQQLDYHINDIYNDEYFLEVDGNRDTRNNTPHSIYYYGLYPSELTFIRGLHQRLLNYPGKEEVLRLIALIDNE